MRQRTLFLIVALVPIVASAQQIVPAGCCGKKPVYTDPAYASFTGQVAIITYERKTTPAVLSVINIQGLNANSAQPPMYSGPNWTSQNLGSIFGVTLDNQGNIYVAATTIYSSKAVGNGGGHGTVYKIANGTGAISIFANLPASAVGTPDAAGLGNLAYDCATRTLFVSDFDDGRIYQLNTSGGIVATFDHGVTVSGTADNPAQTYTQLGRRVWAVRPHNGRLYYSIWWEDIVNQNAAKSNEIWSVAFNVGGFVGGAQLERSMPPLGVSGSWSNPVASINFGSVGQMLATERSMNDTISHRAYSRALEFLPPTWTVLGNMFTIGQFGPPYMNAAGGGDYDLTTTPLPTLGVWVTGDLLFNPPIDTYGLQGLPASGGNIANSIEIDVNSNPQSLTCRMGSVDIPCPCTIAPQINGPVDTCQSPAQYCANVPTGSTLQWSVTGGTYTTSGTCINITWNANGPYTVNLNATAPEGCSARAVKVVTACWMGCCDASITATLNSLTLLGNGNYEVNAALNAPIGLVKRITATIVSAAQSFTPRSCGAPGAINSYIVSAPAQHGFTSSVLPFGREVSWFKASGALIANLAFKFETKLPPLPSAGCNDVINLCVKYEFTATNCRTCEVTSCWTIKRPSGVVGPVEVNLPD